MLLSRYHLLSMWVYCLLCDPLETAFRGAVYCRAQDTLLVFYVGELVLLYPQEWTDLDTLAAGTTEFGIEIVASPLQEAISALAELLGKDATENVLDTIFSQFCIGK